MSVVFDLFAKGIRQAREAAHVHPHRKVCPFGVAGRNGAAPVVQPVVTGSGTTRGLDENIKRTYIGFRFGPKPLDRRQ